MAQIEDSPARVREAPNEAHPEPGRVRLYGVAISEGYRFVDEEGTHVIRSSEFDVYGEGDSLPAAVEDFVAHADDFFHHLAAVMREDELTDRERHVVVALGTRMVEAYRARNWSLEARSLSRALFEAAEAAVRSRRQAGQQREPRAIWDPSPPTTTSMQLPA